MKIKVSEATRSQLDWLVAKCMNTLGAKPGRCFDCKHHEERAGRDDPIYYCHHPKSTHETDYGWGNAISPDYGVHPQCPITTLTPEPYSTDWAQGGPIIDRERISIRQWANLPIVHAYMPTIGVEWSSDDSSPLVAAMRCFVASKLGDEVEVPDELT